MRWMWVRWPARVRSPGARIASPWRSKPRDPKKAIAGLVLLHGLQVAAGHAVEAELVEPPADEASADAAPAGGREQVDVQVRGVPGVVGQP